MAGVTAAPTRHLAALRAHLETARLSGNRCSSARSAATLGHPGPGRRHGELRIQAEDDREHRPPCPRGAQRRGRRRHHRDLTASQSDAAARRAPACRTAATRWGKPRGRRHLAADARARAAVGRHRAATRGGTRADGGSGQPAPPGNDGRPTAGQGGWQAAGARFAQTSSSRRVVPLPTFVVEALAAHMTAYPPGRDGPDLLWCRRSTGRAGLAASGLAQVDRRGRAAVGHDVAPAAAHVREHLDRRRRVGNCRCASARPRESIGDAPDLLSPLA